jgi:valyl-tRNA synthetase
MTRLDLEADGPLTATVPVPGGSVEIRAGELVDREAEERKAHAERERLRAEIDRAEKKLSNEGFVAKAPPQLVDAEREKLERLRQELDGL